MFLPGAFAIKLGEKVRPNLLREKVLICVSGEFKDPFLDQWMVPLPTLTIKINHSCRQVHHTYPPYGGFFPLNIVLETEFMWSKNTNHSHGSTWPRPLRSS